MKIQKKMNNNSSQFLSYKSSQSSRMRTCAYTCTGASCACLPALCVRVCVASDVCECVYAGTRVAIRTQEILLIKKKEKLKQKEKQS